MEILVILILLVTSIFALRIGAKRYLKAKSCVKWPSTDGTVEVSKKEHFVNPSAGNGYIPLVKYRYVIGGKKYRSELISFALNQHAGSMDSVDNILRKYPVGKKVSVKYNPDNYSEAVLEDGIGNTTSVFILVISGIFFIASLYLLIRLI